MRLVPGIAVSGELFDVLTRHSILGRLMEEGSRDTDGFRRGVLAARDGAEGLSGALFSVRTLGLFADVPGAALRDYLSGLLVGHELREALARFQTSEVLLIGSPDLLPRYKAALALFDVSARAVGEEAAVMGLVAIARRAGLTKENTA